MTTLFHIARKADWDAAQATGVYRVPSLEAEGFIHLSTADQVCATAGRFYAGATDLVLLQIDPDRVAAEIRWEQGTDLDQLFPHVYGPLDVDAVTSATAWGPDAQGRFTLPQ